MMNFQRITHKIIRNTLLVSYSFKQQLHLCYAEKVTLPSTIRLTVLRYSSDAPNKCWNCNYVFKSELFCSKCKSLQKMPENLNYFDILGVKLDYNVKNEEVHEKYRQLQKRLHPDMFSNKSEKEKEISTTLSSLVNKAYSTLVHPLQRGIYMLQLKNITIPEETTNLNPEFLLEIMEKNEEVEEAANDKQKVMQLIRENKCILDTFSKKVGEAFSDNDSETAKLILVKMKYYASIDNRLKKLQQDLGIVE